MNIGLLIGSCLTASLSPGPASLSTIETSLRYGKRRTFWHTLGLGIGETPHLFLALYGTHWLTVHVPYALQLIGFAPGELLGGGDEEVARTVATPPPSTPPI